ncbi:cysteine proteinases like protein [Babesia gibsoni]|uniref:Cysteine proteinases like protein n=1 Tax=Babesia gibsoni TaxID=33632 RepID=A0AAD8PEI5_BABGI|nr:cysteine proteinases like protein [Babesia gibsoni]
MTQAPFSGHGRTLAGRVVSSGRSRYRGAFYQRIKPYYPLLTTLGIVAAFFGAMFIISALAYRKKSEVTLPIFSTLEFAFEESKYENYTTVKGAESEDYINKLAEGFYKRKLPVNGTDVVNMYKAFNEFNKTHGRQHESQEDKFDRFFNYKANADAIEAVEQSEEKLPFKYALNKFADVDGLQFLASVAMPLDRSLFKGRIGKGSYRSKKYGHERVSLDYADAKRVSPVKDQGLAPHGWAFAAIAALESQLLHKGRVSVSLSEQQLIDCVDNADNPHSRTLKDAFDYLKGSGVNVSEVYPYTGSVGECTPVKGQHSYRATTFEMVDEPQLLELLKTHGPLAVYVSINDDWPLYSSGVLNSCSNVPNHALLLVGAGESAEGKYWLLKNSWGTDWGINGYVKLLRGFEDGNECGIAVAAAYTTEVPDEDIDKSKLVSPTVTL